MIIRGHQNTCMFSFELAYNLFPFSMPYRFQKHKAHLWEVMGSASSNSILLSKKIQRMNKCIKGKNSGTFFNFFIIKKFFHKNQINGCDCWGSDGRLDTKIDQIGIRHISMSYASYDIKWHIMSYDAYDIEIWHRSTWSILVSKWPSEPQQWHLLIRF